VSPCRPSFYSPREVFPHQFLANQLNFCASCANSFSSIVCALFNSLVALFRARFLCFQQLAHSFAKTPGVGGWASRSGLWTLGGRRRLPVPEMLLRDTRRTSAHPRHALLPRHMHQVALYPLWAHSIAHTPCHHGGVLPPTLLLRLREPNWLTTYALAAAWLPTTLSATSTLPRVAREYGHTSCAASTNSCAAWRSIPGRLTLRRAARPKLP
jgi:hypothetical protein